MRRTVAHGRAAGGQSLAEFALVLPIALLLLFGAIDLGRAAYAYNAIENAARQGTRVAIVYQNVDSGSCNRLDQFDWSIRQCARRAAINLGVEPTDIAISYAPPAGGGASCAPMEIGCVVSVTVVYAYQPLTPIVGEMIGTLNLEATSRMPIERVYP